MNYQPDMVAAAVKMIVSLGAVLAIIAGLLYVQRRFLRGRRAIGRHQLVRVLANTYLGVKKSITVVHVPGSILVLGLGAESVNLLTKIDDEEAVERFLAASAAKSTGSFAAQLGRLTSGQGRRDQDHG